MNQNNYPLPNNSKNYIRKNPEFTWILSSILQVPRGITVADILNDSAITGIRCSGYLKKLKSYGIVDNFRKNTKMLWYIKPEIKTNLSIFIQSLEIEG